MIDWAARANAVFEKNARTPTAITAETPVSSVSSVRPEGVPENSHPGFVGFVGAFPEVLQKNEVATANRWRLHFAHADVLEVTFAPAVDHAGALASYPVAVAAEPIPGTAEPVPADLAAPFDACAMAGLYDDADRAALPAMLALDAEGTRGLIEATHSRIGRCRRCRHFRRPGLSDGYCTGRDDLPHAYGFMHRLPDDSGARCGVFETEQQRDGRKVGKTNSQGPHP